MSLKKSYSKDKSQCKVTFVLDAAACPGANAVNVVGDFNNWSPSATPMTRSKTGEFKVIVELAAGREYFFRYSIDGSRWENDWNADKYVPSPYGDTFNSVVIV